MATTFVDYTGDGDATKQFSFPSYKVEDIKVKVDDVIKTVSTHYNITGYTTTGGGNVVFTSGNIPTSPADIHIYRDTDVDSAKATYTAGSSVKASDLNDNNTQLLYALQEEQNQPIRVGKIKDNAVTTDKILNGTILTADIAGDQITNALIADDQIDSEHYVDGSIDLQHMSANSVDSDQYVDGSIDLIHMSANSVDSDQYVDGSIDLIHMSANSVDSNQYVDGSIDRVHLEADIIDSTKLADDAVNSEHYVDGSIDRVHLEADIIDSTKLADDAVGAEHIQANAVTDSEIATGTLDNRYYTEAELNGGQLNSLYFTESEITGGAADGRYYTETELDAGQLDTRYYTETELNAGQLDNRYYTETEAEALFLRQDSSETIASGDTWSNTDGKVATTAAINARIVDLIDDVGGFTAITSEQHFPNTNPQGSTGQAAILSIQAASTTLTPSGTTVTISNGNLADNANITITGVSAAIPTGFGFLVESTSTLHTYTFHRLVPKATEVTTVATNITNIVNAGANVVDINNFADIYIISGSEPSNRNDGSSLQEGDLWFDSSNDNLQVYTGSAFSIITPSQSVLDDVAIVSGAITYSEDLGLITSSVSTGSSNGSLDIVADILEDEATFTITAATGKFIIDGVDKPALTLYKGWTYTFDVSDASNATHPLRFSSGGSAYNTGVTVTGTQGQAGAKVQLVVPESQPTSFIYYCTAHSGMGNSITVKDDPIKTVSDNITSINTTATNITNVNTTATSISNVNTVGSSISDVNRYANEYQISNSQPGSPSAGDLWFDTSTNTLKNYNGSAWLGITSNSGIADVVSDTSPQLGGALDGQNNNMTNIGTIDGSNLQLDFGTL